MKFTGHERDLANVAGSGDDLDYMHARHYSPLTGRFLSVDPILGTPAVPQSWNRYAYVMGRAMSYTDPTGMQAVVRQYAPTGMTFYDAISVTTTPWVPAWRGTTSNPYTGVWGLSSLMGGSSFLSSLSSLGDLAYLRPSDLLLGRAASLTGQGLAAYTDGLVPFVDPLENFGVYNPEEVGMTSMQVTGEVAVFAASGAAAARGVSVLVSEAASGTGRVAAVGRALLGKGGLLNSNRYLRIGLGRRGGEKVFRLGGGLIQKMTGRAHIDLWTLGKL